MKKNRFLSGCTVLLLAICFASCVHVHLPGHGNVEKENLKEAVVNHITSTLTNGETVEFVGSYNNDYYKDNGEVRFSSNVIYYVITPDGSKEKHTAHVVCNEDRDKIFEWKDI